MTKVILIDPPSGWRFGYPKPLPAELEDASDAALIHWLIENDYPKEYATQSNLDHTRYIFLEEDE